MENNNQVAELNTNPSFHKVLLKFLPFWPLFLILFLISLSLLFLKLSLSVPLYETKASVLIKDESKGSEESKMEEVLNVFDQKKIVENEIEILRSNAIVMDVVKALKLYAPIFSEGGLNNMKITSLFSSFPISIEVLEPEQIIPFNKYSFKFSPKTNLISLEGKNYPLNEWIFLNKQKIRFVKNPNYTKSLNENWEESNTFFSLMTLPAATNDIIGRLTIVPTNKQSSVLSLKIRDEVPLRGELILTQIVEAYNNAAVQRKNSVAFKTLQFIENRLKHVNAELDSVEKGIQKYRDQNSIVDISEQSKQYLESIEVNDRQVNSMNMQLSALDEVEKYVVSKEEGAVVPSTFNITDPTLSNLVEKLAQSESQYEKLKRTTAENNPIVLSLQEEINKIKPSIIENIKNQKKNISASRSYLSQTNQRYSSMLSAIPKKERELVEVSRQQNIKNDIYSFLLQKREETTYSISSALPDCYIVDTPVTGTKPVSPKKEFLALLAIILPISLGFSFIRLKDLLSGKILYRSEIEKITRFPIIGELIHEKNKSNLIQANNKRSFILEQFRQLRNALKYQISLDKGQQRILITSSVKGEGKSFVSANLAISLARSGKKVGLLELDLHQPKLSELFEIGECDGISDFLAGTIDINTELAHITSVHQNLSLIPCGHMNDEPSELLTNGRLEILLKHLDSQYDVLVIDTAPVKAITDAYVIAPYCNLVLYIVRHNYTPKTHIEILDKEMDIHNIENLAIVFNGVKNRGFGKFSYGYGYGYGNDNKSNYSNYVKKSAIKVA